MARFILFYLVLIFLLVSLIRLIISISTKRKLLWKKLVIYTLLFIFSSCSFIYIINRLLDKSLVPKLLGITNNSFVLFVIGPLIFLIVGITAFVSLIKIWEYSYRDVEKGIKTPVDKIIEKKSDEVSNKAKKLWNKLDE